MPDDISRDLMLRSADTEQALLLRELERLARPDRRDMPPVQEPGAPAAASGSALKTMAEGVAELPRAAAHGVVRGGVEAVRAARDLRPADPALRPTFIERMPEADLDEIERVIPPPEHGAGKAVSAVSQFLTGFVAGGRLLKGVKAVSGAAKAAKSAGQGAIADFGFVDPEEGNLANLMRDVPELRGPVTDFLATDPDDDAAVNRLRSAASGIVAGAAAEGLVRSLVWARGARKGPDAAAAALQKVEQQVAEEVDLSWAALGFDPDSPLVRLSEVETPAQVIRNELEPGGFAEEIVTAERLSAPAAPAEPKVFVNLLRINGRDDIHAAVQMLADMDKGDIEQAARGIRTWEKTRESAARVDAWDAMMKQRAANGESIPNAETQLAMRRLWISSADSLLDVAEVTAKSPTPANRYAMRKAAAAYHAIQTETIGMRTETARALNQWRIPAGSTRGRLRAIEAALAQVDESTDAQLARLLASFRGMETQMPQELDAVVRGSIGAVTREAVLKVWINGLLTGVDTHVVNAVSNTAMIGLRVAETKAAEFISSALDTPAGVVRGEASESLFGIFEAGKDLFRLNNGTFWAHLRGEAEFGPGKMEVGKKGIVDPLSAEAFGVASNTVLGKSIDVMGEMAGLPGKALEASDFIFKAINYRMSLHQTVLRQATEDVLAGKVPEDGLKARIAELVANPPEQMVLDATEQALVATFTNQPGVFGRGILHTVEGFPALRLLMPFVRTPVNIFRAAMERGPGAPLVAQWRADVAAGGARRDLALARASIGTVSAMVALDLAMNGLITGAEPATPGEREAWERAGKKPNAVKIGGNWVEIGRLDPMAFSLTTAANLAQALGGDFDEDLEADAGAAFASLALGMGSAMMNKTYMQSMNNLMRAMAFGGSSGESFLTSMAGSAIPALSGDVARAIDPVMRQADELADGLLRRTPWLSKDLPPSYDLWGRERTSASGLGWGFDMVTPARVTGEKSSPVEKEFDRLNYHPARPGRTVTFKAGIYGRTLVPLDLRGFDPKLYSEYVRLAGSGVVLPQYGKPMAELANDIMTGDHWLSQTYKFIAPAKKVQFWQNLFEDHREAAREKIMKENPHLRAKLAEKAAFIEAGQELVQ